MVKLVQKNRGVEVNIRDTTLSKKNQSVMNFYTGKLLAVLYRKSCHAWIIATA
jgi:hypothetical protein